MKLLFLLGSFILLTISRESCKKKNKMAVAKACYKGRLEVKAACMNYTISVQDDIDPSLVLGSWTDDNTGKTYKKVFALGSRCSFPSTINEGDEFYFTIDSTLAQNCAVCMIYYPVPPKKLSIRIVDACP